MTRARRHDLLAIALLSLIATLFFIDVLAGTDNFYMRDLTRYYYPTKQVLRVIVQDGEFPYWNRAFSAGQPIAANPEHEVFYPFTWLILLPSYDFGYRLHILVHIYIGLIGMYALLRSMELRVPASFFGALVFGLGGLYLSYINLLPILFCAAWLPLTCLFVRKFLLRPNVRDFALSSLFLGMQFLVAEPTTVMQTGLLIGMYALYRGWYAVRDWGHPRVQAIPEMLARVMFIGIISGSAILVGAAQMIPALDHVGESARSRTFDYSLVSAWSFPWAKFAELIYPNFLGHISIDRVMWYWGGGLYPGMGSPFLFNIYCGLLVTALAAGAIFVRPRGGRFVLLLCLFSSLIALGGHTPLLRWLYDLHVATSIRYPEKFILVAVFAMIVFASQLLDRMLEGDDAVRDAALGFIAATTVVALLMAIFAFTPWYAKLFIKVWGLKGPKAAAKMVELSRQGWVIAFIRGGVLFALLWSVRTLRRPLWLALMLAFVLADVLPVTHQVNPRMPASFFLDEPLGARALPQDRDRWRMFMEADWYGQDDPAKKYFSTGDAVYWIVRNGLFPMTPAGEGFQMMYERDYDKTALLPTIDLIDSVWDVKRSGRTDWWRPFMAMGNVRYRGEYKPFDAERKRVKKNMKKAVAIQFTDVGQHPRYYFADQILTIADRRDFVKKLSAGDYTDSVAFVHAPSFVPGRGVVRGWRESHNTAVIDVESQGRGFLVMSVTPNKYWTVTLDGRRVTPLVTNIGFQGVIVPNGAHRVEMRYRNTLAANGLRLSIAAIGVLALLALIGRRIGNRMRASRIARTS
ncbi:MAG TPA: hypothetical protein VM733_20760 [Thermoanaerobaculia bacterium]|nr:hypothetical protein [Thermoanaerobaculia bacterium]